MPGEKDIAGGSVWPQLLRKQGTGIWGIVHNPSGIFKMAWTALMTMAQVATSPWIPPSILISKEGVPVIFTRSKEFSSLT
jgi:hypothetical protein